MVVVNPKFSSLCVRFRKLAGDRSEEFVLAHFSKKSERGGNAKSSSCHGKERVRKRERERMEKRRKNTFFCSSSHFLTIFPRSFPPFFFALSRRPRMKKKIPCETLYTPSKFSPDFSVKCFFFFLPAYKIFVLVGIVLRTF